MRGIFARIDDKHIPLYRIVWISEVPHFCGSEECEVEGRYEVRLEADESVFGTRQERDATIEALELACRFVLEEKPNPWQAVQRSFWVLGKETVTRTLQTELVGWALGRSDPLVV